MSSSSSSSSNTRRKRNMKKTACSGLSKKNCIFPCRGVKKNKDKFDFGHCQSIFSKKRRYLNAANKKIVYDGIKRGRQSVRKSKRLREKAAASRKIGNLAIKSADSSDKQAVKEEAKQEGYFNSVTSQLSTNILGLPSAAPENVEETKVEETKVEETKVEETKEEDKKKEETVEKTKEEEETVEEKKEPEPAVVESKPVEEESKPEPDKTTTKPEDL